VGIRDELRTSFGEDFFDPTSTRSGPANWFELCLCGHLSKHHSATVGGAYRLVEQRPKHMGSGRTVMITTMFDGCVGAHYPRNAEKIVTENVDREANTMTERVIVTCACMKFQPVARIDRPNQYFRQRTPPVGDRENPLRHPFVVGVKAFTTHLSKRRAARPELGGDPAWVDAEFDRRFVWLDGARVCGLSKCTETDGVWPVYVDGDRSELRCPQHR